MIIDLSHFQADAAPIDYAAVKTKVTGAYIKLTQATGYTDPAWQTHHAGLAGIPRGGYHFCGQMDGRGHVTYQDPAAEAQHFASVLTKATWELRPVVDIEAAGADPAWLKAFLTALRQATGIRRLRVYTSRSLLTTALDPARWIDPDTDLWAARYNPTLGFDHPQLVLWQHTDAGRVPGITGPVDLSVELHGWTPRADTAPRSRSPLEDPVIVFDWPPGAGAHKLVCPVGSASGVTAQAWLSLACDGALGRFDVWFQSDHAGLAEQHGGLGKDQRAWWAVPDGTTQITVHYTGATGAVGAALEVKPKP